MLEEFPRIVARFIVYQLRYNLALEVPAGFLHVTSTCRMPTRNVTHCIYANSIKLGSYTYDSY